MQLVQTLLKHYLELQTEKLRLTWWLKNKIIISNMDNFYVHTDATFILNNLPIVANIYLKYEFDLNKN